MDWSLAPQRQYHHNLPADEDDNVRQEKGIPRFSQGRFATVDIEWFYAQLQEKDLFHMSGLSVTFLSNTRHGVIIKVTCENNDKKFATLTEKGCELFAQCALCHETAYKAKKMALHKAGSCGWREIVLTSKRVDYKEGGEVGALVRPGDKDKFGSPTCVLEAELAVLVFLCFPSIRTSSIRCVPQRSVSRTAPSRSEFATRSKGKLSTTTRFVTCLRRRSACCRLLLPESQSGQSRMTSSALTRPSLRGETPTLRSH